MIIEPELKGSIALNCFPEGCRQSINEQIEYVKAATNKTSGAKKVLVIGASSGLGLSSRIALAFGGAKADTIGVSWESGPSEKGIGSAGWYNNIYFREAAEKDGLIAKNFIGDAFAPDMRQQVVDYIKGEFGGSVDLVVYSLASGIRPNYATGEKWRSSLKPTDGAFRGMTLDLQNETMNEVELPQATAKEVEDTVKVMGGEDWQDWIDFLLQSGVLADGCKTLAFSYIGSELTYPIYLRGCIGAAKEDLHATADRIHEQLTAAFNGGAWIAVCKALVTKSLLVIPALSAYVLTLYRVMKEQGTHEGCIENLHRLFTEKFIGVEETVVDKDRLIRTDDLELSEETQRRVGEIMREVTADNFNELTDFEGVKKEFMKLSGFCHDKVDYRQRVSLESLQALKV